MTPCYMDNSQDLFMYDILYCSTEGIQQLFFFPAYPQRHIFHVHEYSVKIILYYTVFNMHCPRNSKLIKIN